MTALELTIVLLRRFEGLRLKAYQDCVGVWTIGYGETLGVKAGMVWTKERAESQLQARVQSFMYSVLTACPQLRSEPPTRTAACTSLAYNIGKAAFGVSSVKRKTGRKEYAGAADSFALWNKAGGKVNKILVRRRAEEARVYLG